MATRITDRKWKTEQIALFLRHENFTITDSNSVQTPNGGWVIFVGFTDHTVNEWAQIMIDLETGETVLAT